MTSPAAPPWPPPSATAPGTPTQAWPPLTCTASAPRLTQEHQQPEVHDLNLFI